MNDSFFGLNEKFFSQKKYNNLNSYLYLELSLNLT